MTGLCFGLIVFLDGWRGILGDILQGGNVTTASVISIVIGLIIVAILAIANRKVEVFARNKYGPYTK